MNIHMQRQTTGMPNLLEDKQCIQHITRPRMGKKTQAGMQHLKQWMGRNWIKLIRQDTDHLDWNTWAVIQGEQFSNSELKLASAMVHFLMKVSDLCVIDDLQLNNLCAARLTFNCSSYNVHWRWMQLRCLNTHLLVAAWNIATVFCLV